MAKKTTTQKPKSEKLQRGECYERTFSFKAVRAEEGEDDNRTIEVAFSSEEPVERWGFVEILDHSAGSVRLDRLNDGGPLLMDHNSRDQIGVIESARIDSDRVGRALVRFSKVGRGDEIYQDVIDNIRTKVSVQYRIRKYEVKENDGSTDEIRVTDWEPLEISFVSIPADNSVGKGRSQTDNIIHPGGARMDEEEIIDLDVDDNNSQRTGDPAGSQSAKKPNQQRQQPVNHTAARKAERDRIAEIDRLGDEYKVPDLARQAIDEEWPVEKFRSQAFEVVGKRNNEIRSESDHDGNVDLSRNDLSKFSFVRLMNYLAAQYSGKPAEKLREMAAFELEVGEEAVRGYGADFNIRGAYVPDSVLYNGQRMPDWYKIAMQARDLSAGTATDGAELVATNLLSGSYIETLRNAARTMQAGVRVLPGLVGNVDIPRKTSGAASTWITAEDGDATESEPQFDQISLTPKDLACYTEVTRRLLQQSTPSIDMIVRDDLAVAQGLGIDLAILYGAGSGGVPEGIANATGINVLDLVAADPTYAELVAMIRLVAEDNALMGSPVWMIDPNGWEALSTTPKQASGVEGNFILSDTSNKIVGHDYYMTNQVTSEQYFFGDFTQALLGEWGGLELNVDPYTHSLKGKIRYIIFKTCDTAIRHPEAFCYAHDGIV